MATTEVKDSQEKENLIRTVKSEETESLKKLSVFCIISGTSLSNKRIVPGALIEPPSIPRLLGWGQVLCCCRHLSVVHPGQYGHRNFVP